MFATIRLRTSYTYPNSARLTYGFALREATLKFPLKFQRAP